MNVIRLECLLLQSGEFKTATAEGPLMIIAQITDLHIGFEGQGKPCQNVKRLRSVLEVLNTQIKSPDFILLTGDLVEIGENWAYETLKDELASLKIPYYFSMGNHDDRQAFLSAFPDCSFEDGFLQYTIEGGPLRIIVLDTLEPGLHGGAFCEGRAEWLRQKLTEQPDRPTLIALHHPPVPTGIEWMTASPDDPWVKRLSAVLNDFENIVHIISGHIHRSIFTKFAGTTLSVSLAVAPQVKLELADIDPNDPDGRVLLTNSAAGYALHEWNGTQMTTHQGLAPEGEPIIHFDEKHAFVVRHTLDLPPD